MSTMYSESHEWARQDGEVYVIGLSSFAAGEVGEVIHVELPAVGDSVTQGEAMGEIESVKSVNDIYAPVTGTVEAVNEALADQPEYINQDAMGKGWLLTVRASSDDPCAGLMDEAAYQAHIRS